MTKVQLGQCVSDEHDGGGEEDAQVVGEHEGQSDPLGIRGELLGMVLDIWGMVLISRSQK